MLYSFEDQQIRNLPQIASGELTDEELLAQIQVEDEQALATLYRRHKLLLRTVVGRVLHNEYDADDLLQEVFIEIWRQAAHYDERKGKALGWMITLARRRAIDKLRKKMSYFRAQERLREESERAPEPAMHHGADEEASAADTAKIFQRVLATLPEAQRSALDFAFYRGMSQREIATHTGIPLGTIKTRLELALRKVRTAITALGDNREWLDAGI